jgi:hypothetical protein
MVLAVVWIRKAVVPDLDTWYGLAGRTRGPPARQTRDSMFILGAIAAVKFPGFARRPKGDPVRLHAQACDGDTNPAYAVCYLQNTAPLKPYVERSTLSLCARKLPRTDELLLNCYVLLNKVLRDLMLFGENRSCTGIELRTLVATLNAFGGKQTELMHACLVCTGTIMTLAKRVAAAKKATI